MTSITLRNTTTDATTACTLHHTSTGLRVIDPLSPATADALYVADDLDALTEQINASGYTLVEYESLTEDDEIRERDAQAMARRVLSGADLAMDWRDAGYGSAYAAATALVGDAGSGEDLLYSRATVLVRDAIATPAR